MVEFPLIMISIAMIILLIGVIVAVYVYKKRKHGIIEKSNYQAFFIMGISFLAMGIIFTSSINPGFIGFIALGIIYMTIGLANRDKWEKK
jgi:hypothetical protein